MSSRALVVGASGQVGHRLAVELGDGALRAGRVQQISAQQTKDWVHIDLAGLAHDPEQAEIIIDSHELSAVYCVGGATDVERCEAERDWAMDTNCYGPSALAKAARHVPFIYFSTEYVFDGRNGPYEEDSETNPLSIYGRSKLCGEQSILSAHPKPLIVRTTVVFGHDPFQRNFLYSLRRLLTAGQTMRVPADQVSTPTYNRDLAAATIELVNRGQGGIFHVCGPELLSRYEFALVAASILGLDDSLVTAVPTSKLGQRAPRPLAAGLKTAKLRRTLPQTHMRSNADAILDWISREHVESVA
ncbi:MAG: NAD(P)-dependent oxidoreductase [Terriglobales bacterium]|jgi:dTDP-4-dehydrorhamnose reductase